MFAWLGFLQTEVAFHRLPRLAGETKYPFLKMLRLATHGLLSFSDAPLRLAIWCGVCVSLVAILFGLYVLGLRLGGYGHLVEGWTSTVVIIAFLCGLNMLMTGIVGLYVGRIHSEVKRRPLYVVAQKVGFEEAAESAAREGTGAAREVS
jgi:dolichol-phosphate mannosyltransferase